MMQRYTIYLFLCNAPRVSGGSSAHHQEHKTVYTVSGTLSNCDDHYSTISLESDRVPDAVYTVLSS